MKNTWYVFDQNLTYAERLTDYLVSRQPIQVRVETYSDGEALKKKLETGPDDNVLIVPEGSFEEWMGRLKLQLVLLEESGSLELPEAIRINRYQSAEGIWEELVTQLGRRGKRVRLKRQVNESAGLVSFFSPSHRVLQTTFALQYGKALSEKGPALFLHFDGLGNLEELFGASAGKSLMDLLYLWECGGEEALEELPGEPYKNGEYSVLLNAGAPGDIRSVKEETWLGFLEALQNCGSYSHVLLDLNEHVDGLTGILQMSQTVIEVHRPEDYEDRMDALKQKEYEKLLEGQGFSGILEARRIIRLPLMDRAPAFPGDLGAGELYRLAEEACGE